MFKDPPEKRPAHTTNHGQRPRARQRRGPFYAAIDLGTNNCRLLIVEASKQDLSFRVRDSFSRIVRLGEGLNATGQLSDDAMDRTLAALRICASKIRRANVKRIRCVATEACRDASNGAEFIARVKRETGLKLEIIDGEQEAKYAAIGCGSLFEEAVEHILIFDIGGGSTEISRLDRQENGFFRIADSESVPLGVVRLAERFTGEDPRDHGYDDMMHEARAQLDGFMQRQPPIDDLARLQIIGTSGTVTTLAAVQLGLARYDRNQVDGCKIQDSDIRTVIDRLVSQSRDDFAQHPCIGHERADLVLAGCAVLDVIHQHWPVSQVSVADRGLREGILNQMIRNDRRRRRGRGRGRRGGRPNSGGTHG